MGKDSKPTPVAPAEQPAHSDPDKTFGEIILVAGDAALEQIKKDRERQERLELLQQDKRRTHQICKELRAKKMES